MQTQIRIKQSQMIGRPMEGIKLNQMMVDLEVSMRILGVVMWKVDVIQEDNSKSNAWKASIDQTKLKTCSNIPMARL